MEIRWREGLRIERYAVRRVSTSPRSLQSYGNMEGVEERMGHDEFRIWPNEDFGGTRGSSAVWQREGRTDGYITKKRTHRVYPRCLRR
jgi:hypothetical protein